MRLILCVALSLSLVACGEKEPSPPPAPAAQAPAASLDYSVQRPIDAANQAVSQIEATQKRMDDELKKIDTPPAAQAPKEEDKTQ